MSQFAALGTYALAAALQSVHGEAVMYTPSGAAAQAILAVVLRGPLQTRQADGGRRLEYEHELLVSQADVPTVVVNGDTVAFAKRAGDAATITKTVTRIVGQAGGLWHLGMA